MMKFSYQFDENAPKIKMQLDPQASLKDILIEFKRFLLACGYTVKGDVVIENTDKEFQND